jgi:hypothetical protein
LHGLRIQPLADVLHPKRARGAIVGGGADLDELVGLERAVDLGEHLVGEPLLAADDHDGDELVRLGAQFAAARRCECHSSSIRP